MENALNLDTVVLAEDKKHVVILNQTLLPNECKYLTINRGEDIWEAIYSLRVRGAPAIGVCAGYALALAGLRRVGLGGRRPAGGPPLSPPRAACASIEAGDG